MNRRHASILKSLKPNKTSTWWSSPGLPLPPRCSGGCCHREQGIPETGCVLKWQRGSAPHIPLQWIQKMDKFTPGLTGFTLTTLKSPNHHICVAYTGKQSQYLAVPVTAFLNLLVPQLVSSVQSQESETVKGHVINLVIFLCTEEVSNNNSVYRRSNNTSLYNSIYASIYATTIFSIYSI